VSTRSKPARRLPPRIKAEGKDFCDCPTAHFAHVGGGPMVAFSHSLRLLAGSPFLPSTLPSPATTQGITPFSQMVLRIQRKAL